MATCYDCIHCDACSDACDGGFSCLKEDASKCKHYKNKADYAEVKHGEWIRPTIIHGMTIAGLPHCSVCGEVPCDEGKYCPNCGADMRGDKSENL